MKIDFSLRLSRPAFELDAAASAECGRVGLFGPSGAGKTTLVRIIAGLDDARGELFVDGECWQHSGGRGVAPHLRQIGWVPQASALMPHLSVEQNLRFAADHRAETFDEVADMLELRPLLRQRATLLSGGEQKRVALGRALLSQSKLLLLDEPFSGLDWPHKTELLGFLLRTLRTFDTPAILVSHDPFEIGVFCETIWLLENGRIIGTGTPEEVFLQPKGVTQAMLAGVENIWRGTVVERDAARMVQIGREYLSADLEGYTSGTPVVAVLAAAEVLLTRATATRTSARNVWHGRVRTISRRGREVAVHVDCNGVSLVALITPAALSELALEPGVEAHALFKASAARVFRA